jgi:hypothetical protein
LIANSPVPGQDVPIATLAVAVTTTPVAGTVETWTFSSAPPAALQVAGQYRFTVDTEICIDVTGGGGASRQIQRGAEGSTVATHLLGAGIYHGLTAAGLANYIAGIGGGVQLAGDLGGTNSTPIVETVLGGAAPAIQGQAWDVSLIAGIPTVIVATHIGISASTGRAYTDPAGPAAGEEAVIVFDTSGRAVAVRPIGAV